MAQADSSINVGTAAKPFDSLGGFAVNGTTVINSSGTLLTAPDITVAGTTTGIGLALDDNTALTTGQLIAVASSATAITTTGRLLSVVHSGATTTSGTLVEFKTSANDETILAEFDAASLTSGTIVQLVGTAVTTGKGLSIAGLDALTSGIGINLTSAATAITGAGRLLYSNHTGATGTSAVLNEFASAANDETVVLRVTASAALAAGNLVDLSGTAVTTGTILDLGGLDALTTGTGINVVSNSASNGTRSLVNINNDNTAATGTTPLAINNDATAGAHIKLTGTGILGIDFTALGATDFLWDCTAASGCTAAPQTNAAVGFITCKVGGTQQWIPYYNST